MSDERALHARIEKCCGRAAGWLWSMQASAQPTGVLRFSRHHDPARWPGVLLPSTYNGVMALDLLGELGPLAARLAPELSPVDRLAETRKLAEHLAAGTVPIGDVLAQIRQQRPGLPRLVLIADQFEEAFTLCGDEKLRQAFFAALLQAAETPWLTVILTLRADFFGRVLADERLGPRVDRGLVNVLPMTAAERRK